jgi:hypothetical protein
LARRSVGCGSDHLPDNRGSACPYQGRRAQPVPHQLAQALGLWLAAGAAQAAEGLALQKVTVDGAELHYVEQGQGTPLVLVHGGLIDYREWEPQMARFAQDHQVIAYSQRYYHPNENLPIAPGYTTLVNTADLAAFLQALRLDRSNVVSYSSGAFMALAMAMVHPELVRTLTRPSRLSCTGQAVSRAATPFTPILCTSSGNQLAQPSAKATKSWCCA